jgi:hypothetical protein
LRAVWSDNEGLRRRNNLSIPQVWPAPTDWSTRNVSSGCLPTLTPSTMGSGLVLCITSRSPFGSISADRAGARRGPRRLRCQVLAISVQRSAFSVGSNFPRHKQMDEASSKITEPSVLGGPVRPIRFPCGSRKSMLPSGCRTPPPISIAIRKPLP